MATLSDPETAAEIFPCPERCPGNFEYRRFVPGEKSTKVGAP